MKSTSFFIFIFITLFSSICGIKVLGVFQFDSTSHFAIGSAIIDALHEAGHEVTVISAFPKKSPIPRYHDISLVDYYDKSYTSLYLY